MKKLLLLTLLVIVTLGACTAPSLSQESKAKDIAEELKTQDPVTEESTIEEVQEETLTSQETETTSQKEAAQESSAYPENSNSITGMSSFDTLPSVSDVEETVTLPAQYRTKMYQFVDTYAKRVRSYEFFLDKNHYSYKNDKFRVILSTPVQVKDVVFGDLKKSLYYYDTIYVDRVGKTVVAYCEGHEEEVNRQCAELEIYDLAYPLPYTDHNIALPHDLLFRYVDFEPDSLDANKYYIKGRASTTVKFNGNTTIELHIDPETGLPIRFDQLKGSQLIKRTDFEKLASNKIRDVDVLHRSKNEIPSSELFYK